MTRNRQVHDGSADKFALRKTLRRHRGYPGGVDWHWRTSIRLRRRNGVRTGKRLAGKLHEPFERAGGGRARAPPPPTLQVMSSASLGRHSNAERRRQRIGRAGTVAEGPNERRGQ